MPEAAAIWTLTRAGVTKTLAAWGARDPRLVFRSLAEDELTFTIAGDVLGDCPFAYGEPVSLAKNGAAWFSGTVVAVTAVASYGEGGVADLREYWSVRVANAWWQLGRLVFQQSTACYSSACAKIIGRRSSKVVLYQHDLTGGAISSGQQIQDAITFALAAGVSVVAGSAPAGVTPPFEVVRDLTVADVIRRCVQWTPDAVSWCVYGGGAPTLHVQQRAALAGVAIDLAADSGERVVEFALRRRDDLIPAGVRLNYFGVVHCDEPPVEPGCETPGVEGLDAQLTTLTQDTAGAPDLPGGIVGSMDLAQLDAETTEAAPSALAGEYYASLLTPQWEGRIVLRARECSGAVRPGKVVNLSGGHAAWGAMDAVVQEVEESLYSGQTIVTLGPPAHLGPQDFVALMQLVRRRPLVQTSYVKTRAPGTGETPNCDAGKDPEAKKVLDKLKGNQKSAAESIGGEAIEGTMTRSGGQVSVQDVELCDPPGTTVKLWTKP